MSAIGAVPGYGYPSFDYAQAEFIGDSLPNAVTSAGNAIYPIAVAGNGYAVFIRDIFLIYLATAAAGTRRLDQHIRNPDGAVVSSYTAPLTVGPSGQIIFNWSVALAQAYSTTPFAYSPMSSIVMPPGWSMDVTAFGAAAGDTITSVGINGIRLPTYRKEDYSQQAVAVPRFA